MTLPTRTFGVEIELKGLNPEQAERALVDAGLFARNAGYTHQRTDYWKVVTDGSLHGVSCEVVSPVLSGENGIEQLRKACRALSRAGGRVDRECGLHVHVGTDGLTANDVAMIVTRYARFESVIDTWMPPSRRGSANSFCKPIGTFAARLTGRSYSTIQDVLRNYSGDRYLKVNLDAYNRHRTIEFRQHGGTINGNKIENWVTFLLHFVEASRNVGVQVAAPDERRQARSPSRPAVGLVRPPSRLRANSLEAKMDAVILAFRSTPTSLLDVTEIAAAGGWAVASVAPYVTRLRQERGCDLRKVRGSNRYYLIPGTGRLHNEAAPVSETPAPAPNATEVVETQRAARTVLGVGNLAEDSVFRSIPPEIVSFFEERAAEFTVM